MSTTLEPKTEKPQVLSGLRIFRRTPTEPRTPSPERPRRHERLLALTFALIAVAAIAAAVFFGMKWARLDEELTAFRRKSAAMGDSLVLARQYDTLSTEVLDLQQELYARQAGIIPFETHPIAAPNFAGSGPLVGARPVPSYFRLAPPPEEQRAAALELARIPIQSSAGHIRGIYEQADVANSGALEGLTRRGFVFSARTPRKRGTTNSIVIGTDIPVRDAVVVAYELVTAGIQVKRIRVGQESSRKNTIELVYSRQVVDWPDLTVNELRRFAARSGTR